MNTKNTFFSVSFPFVLENGSTAAAITIPTNNLKRAMEITSKASNKDLFSCLQELRRDTGALFHGVHNQGLHEPKIWKTVEWLSNMLNNAFELRRNNTSHNIRTTYVYPTNTTDQFFFHPYRATFYGTHSPSYQHPIISLARRLAEEINKMYQNPGPHWQAFYNLFKDPWNDFLGIYHLTPDYSHCMCPACIVHKSTKYWAYPRDVPASPHWADPYVLSIATVKAKRPIDNPDLPQAKRVTLGALLPARVYLNTRLQQGLWRIQERRDPEQLLRVLRRRGATLFLRVDSSDVGALSLQRLLSRVHRHLCARHSSGKSHNPYALPIISLAGEHLTIPYSAQEFTLHPPVYTREAPFAEALQYVAKEILYKYYDRQSQRLDTWINLFKDPIAPSYTHVIHWTPRHHTCHCGICQMQRKSPLTLPEAHFLAAVSPRENDRLPTAEVAEEAPSPSI
ncbi:MAG: hypothetical protein GXN93_04115 [Candidatus Diapherotrites archaeon]|nr:hypothetical protein [Candidatus Diapherotrites archaeon]